MDASSTPLSTSSNVISRQKDKIYLIGYITHQITGSKLPSNGQVLKSLFYNKRHVKLDTKDAARLTIQEVLIFWEKARIPTKQLKNCIIKLENLYGEWRKLQKGKYKSSTEFYLRNIDNFKSNLDDLFDIAHQDAIKRINEEDKQFLHLQRQKGRLGCMGGVDKLYSRSEERKAKRRLALQARRDKTLQQTASEEKIMELPSTSSESESDYIEEEEDSEYFLKEDDEPGQEENIIHRGTREIITDKLSVLLDRCNISDRDATRIISATAEALDENIDNLSLSRTTIRIRRQKFREERMHLIKSRFENLDLKGAVLHWDGKLLPHLLNKEVERLAVLISLGNLEQLIGVPLIENSKGSTQAKAVFSELQKWGAAEKIEAMCFDTTSVNTGRMRGTCVLLEQMLDKDLLHLACRHHILEIVLKAVFDIKMGATTGPQPEIFKKFKLNWSEIDKNKYKPGIEDEKVKEEINDVEEVGSFITGQLQNSKYLPREDYRELLLLCLIFIGFSKPHEVSFRAPGAMHHARWMAKAIYCLKIFIFRNEFPLTLQVSEAIRIICVFIINIYVKAWFNAPDPTLAPNQDLKLIKSLISYKKTDAEVSEVALTKFINHLWYLNPEIIAFGFFDNSLNKDIKIKMALKVLSYENDVDQDYNEEYRIVKLKVQLNDCHSLLSKELDSFITPFTLTFFKRFNISTQFLKSDPDEWCTNLEFSKGYDIVKNLKVVNDAAERGIKLVQEFNTSITKDEEQKQYLLQVVSECRKLYPDVKKTTLSKPLPL